MNNVDNVLSVLIKGVNKCNLHLILEHLDPGLNLPVYIEYAEDKHLNCCSIQTKYQYNLYTV